jgi:hypothetical protein
MTEEDEEFERIKRRIELETLPLINFTKQKEWVGLTDNEKHEIRYSHMTSAEFIDFIEAKLKEKNYDRRN